MNEHQAIVDYLVARGEDSYRVGIQATEVLRRIDKFRMKLQKPPKYSIELIWTVGVRSLTVRADDPWSVLDGARRDFGDKIAGYIVRTLPA